MKYYGTAILKSIQHNFYVDLWAPRMSHLRGFVGGIILCITVWRGRRSAAPMIHSGSS